MFPFCSFVLFESIVMLGEHRRPPAINRFEHRQIRNQNMALVVVRPQAKFLQKPQLPHRKMKQAVYDYLACHYPQDLYVRHRPKVISQFANKKCYLPRSTALSQTPPIQL